MDACVKNIEDESWRTFKSEATRHGLKLGEFFSKVVSEHENRCHTNNWRALLHGKKKLKGVLTRDDFTKLRNEFRRGVRMRVP